MPADYCSLAEYKANRRISDGLSDPAIARCIPVASRLVEQICGREFGLETAPSARAYLPPTNYDACLVVDDFSTTTGLVVSDFGTTLTLGTDFYVAPLNGLLNTGEPGAYWEIVRFYDIPWTMPGKGGSVSVTAQWGWTTVPDVVKEATIELVSDLMSSADARFGVIGLDVGAVSRVRQNTNVRNMLAAYVRADRARGFGFG